MSDSLNFSIPTPRFKQGDTCIGIDTFGDSRIVDCTVRIDSIEGGYVRLAVMPDGSLKLMFSGWTYMVSVLLPENKLGVRFAGIAESQLRPAHDA